MANDPKQSKRPPIVVVMGHVDHGKTTLLDFIRKSNVAAKEAGGITQAVGAYEIVHNNEKITFIDTPGHEAFTKMRSRGAQIADIAILVVAADDGVKPQTKEALKIILESETPYIVAINKIDKNGANVEKTKTELLQNNVLLEGMGGSISFQPLSAKTGEGVNELLDLILLTAEVEGFTHDPNAVGQGFILEAKIDRKSGVVAVGIVKNGTLKIGSPIHAGTTAGKIRDLQNFLGTRVKELQPSSPAIILGFEKVPAIGEEFFGQEIKAGTVPQAKKRVLPTIDKAKGGMNLILKANVAGSLEALNESMKKLKVPDNTILSILDESVGDVTDGDAKLAVSSNAMIIAFNVRISPAAKTLINAHDIKVFESEIIYELLESVEKELSGEKKKMIAGDLEILAVFDQKNPGQQIIGGKVNIGEIKNQSTVEVSRRGAVVGTGKIVNLQHKKKDIPTLAAGLEGGLLFSSQVMIAVGDHLISHPE